MRSAMPHPRLAVAMQGDLTMNAAAEAIKETVKVCMFDQYGTVVDMQGGLTAVVAPYLKRRGGAEIRMRS